MASPTRPVTLATDGPASVLQPLLEDSALELGLGALAVPGKRKSGRATAGLHSHRSIDASASDIVRPAPSMVLRLDWGYHWQACRSWLPCQWRASQCSVCAYAKLGHLHANSCLALWLVAHMRAASQAAGPPDVDA